MHQPSTALADPIRLPKAPKRGTAANALTMSRDSRIFAEPVDGHQMCDAMEANLARKIIAARARRGHLFGSQLFADPAWDMLLELYALTCEGRRVSVSKLSLAAGVPCTTALRWIDKLEAECLLVRTDDSSDARRVWITLSQSGHWAMQSFIEQV